MKTLEEMIKGFNRMCGRQHCTDCKYHKPRIMGERRTINHIGECGVAYAFEHIVGESSDMEASASQLPAWVKVGQWVEFAWAKDNRPYKILGVRHRAVHICNMADDEREVYYGECKPVRFREYTYEEAKGLIGKAMERVNPNGAKIMEIIGAIVDLQGVVHINECVFNFLKRTNATIDGVPIGVPEVDEEAMKEVEE